MLCSVKFHPEDQRGYDPEWGVVYNIKIGYDSTVHEANKMEVLDRKIKAYYEEHRMTDEGAVLRDKIIKHVAKLLDPVYPTGRLMCGGSTISRCGAVDSDMDLCYVVKTCEKEHLLSDQLPIEMYKEQTINVFMIDRMALALLKYPLQITELATVPARVPLVKGKMLSTVVDPTGPAQEFELDIQCNCVAGVYNSYLLGGFANCDERLPQLSMILKKWAKNVKIVDQNRFNSYTVTLLVVHFLQCGVYPPVLPNLIKLMPEQFDGNIEPWKLSTTIDESRLPVCQNTMSVGELFCAFFNYYNDFNFDDYGILIRDAAVIEMANYGRFGGAMGSKVFLEEPYDGLTVPKNVKEERVFEHIRAEFRYAAQLFSSAKKVRKFKVLMDRVHEPRFTFTPLEDEMFPQE